MAFELKAVAYAELVKQLLEMKPGERKNFQPDPELSPIRVECMDGKYKPEDVMFRIVYVRYGHRNDAPWRDAERTACGIFYLQGEF